MKNRARLEILNYVMQFCLNRKIGKDYLNHIDGFFEINDHPVVGDLVVPTFSQNTDRWYLSWYEGMVEHRGSMKHLVISIEDESECVWSNIGFLVCNRNLIEQHPEWKYTDKQYMLLDRWKRVCSKYKESFHFYGSSPIFNDTSVIFRIRKSGTLHNKPDEFIEKRFDNWKKVKIKDMQNFWIESKNSQNNK